MLPAPGVGPGGSRRWSSTPNCPRARGDGPSSARQCSANRACSPHPRGCSMAFMGGLPLPVTHGQIPPGDAHACAEVDAVQHTTVVTSLPAPPTVGRQVRQEPRPLLVRQIATSPTTHTIKEGGPVLRSNVDLPDMAYLARSPCSRCFGSCLSGLARLAEMHMRYVWSAIRS